MRLAEFEHTLRTKEIGDDDLPESIAKFIMKHCSEFLEVAKSTKNFLYRGDSNHIEDFFIGRTKEDRNPLNSMPHEQIGFDAAIANLGFKALRSNSIFCTTKRMWAASYGRCYIIFPMNGFDFTWSPNVSDFYQANFRIRDWDAFARSCDYKNSDLVGALSSTNEILIHGKFVAIQSKFSDELKRALFR